MPGDGPPATSRARGGAPRKGRIAPITGRIGRSVASVGDLVGPNTGTLTTLVSMNPIEALFTVSEAAYVAAMKERLNKRPEVEALRDALGKAEGKVLGFCRSGTRSTIVWALGQAGHRPVEEIMQAGAEVGYDFRPVQHLLGQQIIPG